MKYDYLIVGSGLYGATFAYLAHKQGKKCVVIEGQGDRYLDPYII
jgi:UDP-galactopyranose mutase